MYIRYSISTTDCTIRICAGHDKQSHLMSPRFIRPPTDHRRSREGERKHFLPFPRSIFLSAARIQSNRTRSETRSVINAASTRG